jgi:hypothetical protein
MDDWRERAKDSLNVRASSKGEWAAKRFKGDPGLAVAYLPLANQILGAVTNQLTLGGISYGHRRVALPNGVVIRVIRNGADNIIEIDVPTTEELTFAKGSLFLEGGWCGLVPIEVPYDRLTDTILADINYGKISITDPTAEVRFRGLGANEQTWFDWVSTVEGQLPEPTRAYGEGMPSLALPERRLAWYTESPPDGVTEAQRQMGDKTFYAHRYFYSQTLEGGLISIKPYRPSAMTGKLKMLVQAVLARNAPTHNIIQAFGEPSQGNSGLGLFTTRDYHYYLIKIGFEANQVEVVPLLLGGGAEFIRTYLLTHTLPRNLQKRIEAYLLSRLVEFQNTSKISIFEFPDDYTTMGSPIAYGWHFSWQGREASAILHTAESNESGTHIKFLATQHTLKFHENGSFDPERPLSSRNKPITVTLESSDPEVWYPLDTDLIWFPDRLGKARVGVMERFGPIRSTQWGQMLLDMPGFVYDAPLYCFYEHSCSLGGTTFSMEADSSLRVLRYTKTVLPTPYGFERMETRATLAYDLTAAPWPGPVVQQTDDEEFSPKREEGFYLTNSEIDQRRTVHGVAGPVTLELRGVSNGASYDLTTADWIGLATGWGDKQTSHAWVYGGIGQSTIISPISILKNGTGFVVIPYFSAEAVYIAKLQKDVVPNEYRHFAYRTLNMIATVGPLRNTLYPLLWGASIGLGVSDGTYTVSVSRPAQVQQEFSVSLSTSVEEYDIEITPDGKVMTEDEQLAAGGLSPKMTLGGWEVMFSNPAETGTEASYIFNVYGGVDTAMFYTADISEPDVQDQMIATEDLPDTIDKMLYGYFLGAS